MSNPLVTTDATTTTLATYSPPEGNSLAVWSFDLTATTGAVCAAWSLQVTAKRSAGTTALVGSVATIAEQKDAGAGSWAVTVDVSGGNVRLRVTGAAATTITWALQGPRQRMTGTGGAPLWTETT